MVEPFELEEKCIALFSRLGWDVSYPNPGGADPGYDLELKYNGELYGAILVIKFDDLKKRAKLVELVLDRVVNSWKPRLYVITNGFAFDIYLLGAFFGTLTVPPTPEDIDVLFGGEDA